MSRRQVARAFTLPESPRKESAPESDANATNWRDQLRDIRVLESNGAAHALQAETYLRGRGIDLETAIAAGAMFAPKFYGRGAVVFPICNREGQQTGASGRYFHANATPKTRIAGTKRNGLFATPGALAGETIIVAEAPIDALSLASVGFGAVALCGTSAPSWIHLACGLKRVLLAFDADDAGDNAAAALAAFLSPYGARCERLRPQGAKDWNEALQRDCGALRMMLVRAMAKESSTRLRCGNVREFEPRDLYNPCAAREFAYRDQSLAPNQRATLLQYAAQSVEKAGIKRE
jgi:DNA primase